MSAERVWLCWSASQQAVHVETEAAGCKTNLRAFVLNQPTDFVPLAVFPNREAAREFAREIQDIRDKRQEGQSAAGGEATWN
jgi:hypothetical protein